MGGFYSAKGSPSGILIDRGLLEEGLNNGRSFILVLKLTWKMVGIQKSEMNKPSESVGNFKLLLAAPSTGPFIIPTYLVLNAGFLAAMSEIGILN